MPAVSAYQSGFSSGELSPRFAGRPDAERYKTGLDLCQNYVVTPQGALIRRPGTYFAGEVKDSSARARLVPFIFSTSQAYVLELGNQTARFFRNGAQITETAKNITGATKANPCVITSTAHGFTNGDRVYITGVGGMVELNGREFTVAGATANTFQLSGVDSSAYTTYTSSGTVARIYQITTPWTTAQLQRLQWAQSADTLYVVHPDVAPYKITRTGHTAWTCTAVTFIDGPYLSRPQDNPTFITPGSNTVGVNTTFTVTTGPGVFSSGDVGRLIRYRSSAGATWGYAIITSYTSATLVNATIQRATGAAIATDYWQLGVWSPGTGYPAVVAWHQDRLVLGGCPAYPFRLDMSNTGLYEDFRPNDPFTGGGTVTDANTVSVTLNTGGVNGIRWVSSDEKGLLVGTSAAEFRITPSSDSDALTPDDVSANEVSRFGSASLMAVRAGKAVLFLQRGLRKIRDLSYYLNSEGFYADDLTILSEHMTASGVREFAWAQEPVPIAWVVTEDGSLKGMTYERTSEVLRVGWHRHVLGGVSDAAGSAPVVESVAVIPSTTEDRDELWLIVRRRINGTTKRYVEWMTPFDDLTTERHDVFYVDCGLSMDTPSLITAVTQANPCAITTSAAHGLTTGDTVFLAGLTGMDELDGGPYTVTVTSGTAFTLDGVNSTGYVPYVSGGSAWKRQTAFSGVSHLAGQTVDVCGDGAEQSQIVVSSTGGVTLSAAAGVVHLGLPIEAKVVLPRVDAGAARGTAVGATRRAHRIAAVLLRTGCLKVGYSSDDMFVVDFRAAGDPVGRAVPLFTGDRTEEVAADYSLDGKLILLQDKPLPGTILGVTQHLGVNER